VDWCEDNRVEVRYIQPGKPNQNAYIECFNRSYRNEVLDVYLFESLEDVRRITRTWRRSEAPVPGHWNERQDSGDRLQEGTPEDDTNATEGEEGSSLKSGPQRGGVR